MSRSGAPTEVGNRLKYFLLSLEDRDLEDQAIRGVRAVVDQTRKGETLKQLCKELLTGLESAGAGARRHRYALAAYVVERCQESLLPQVLRISTRQVFKRIGEEKQTANIQAAGEVLTRVVERVMMLQKAPGGDGVEDTSAIGLQDWLSKNVLSGILKAICRNSDKYSIAMGCSLLHGVLSALMDWTHSPGVVHIFQTSLEHVVKSMAPGSHAPKAAEAFPIIQRCMEVLGLHASPNVVSAALDICLVAVKERSDFQVRRCGFETITTIAASVQAQSHQGGQWELKSCPVLTAVMQKKAKLIKVLENAKYDKILLVRKSAVLTGLELENIPDTPVATSIDSSMRKQATTDTASTAQQQPRNNEKIRKTQSSFTVGGASSLRSSRGKSASSDKVTRSLSSISASQESCKPSRMQHKQLITSSGNKMSTERTLKSWQSAPEKKDLNFGVQVYAPSRGTSESPLHSVSDLSKAGCTHLDMVTQGPLPHGLQTVPCSSSTHLKSLPRVDEVMTTKSCSVSGDSVPDGEARADFLASATSAPTRSSTARSICYNNRENIPSQKWSLSGVHHSTSSLPESCMINQTTVGEEKESINHFQARAQNLHGRLGHKPPGKSESANATVECEELLNQTIVTLKKCRDGLPQGSDDLDACVASSCQATPASINVKRLRENNRDNAQSGHITDTERLSQKSGVEHHDDNPLFGGCLMPKVQTMNLHVGGLTQSTRLPQSQSGDVLATAEPASHEGSRLQGSERDIVPISHGSNAVQCVLSPLDTVTDECSETLQNMLNARTQEIQNFYRKQEALHLQFLDMQMERSMSLMKAVIEQEKSLIRIAAQEAMHSELTMFKERFGELSGSFPQPISDTTQEPLLEY